MSNVAVFKNFLLWICNISFTSPLKGFKLSIRLDML